MATDGGIWKRHKAWFIAVVLIALCAAGLWNGERVRENERARVLEERRIAALPTPQSVYWGIALGASPEDVTFMKGKPDQISDYRCGMTICHLWLYAGLVSTDHAVSFRDGKVWSVEMRATLMAESQLTPVLGIDHRYSMANVGEVLGKPDEVSSNTDSTRRMVSYDRYRVFYSFERDQLKTLGIYNPDQGRPQY